MALFTFQTTPASKLQTCYFHQFGKVPYILKVNLFPRKKPWKGKRHSHPQRPRSFWSTQRIRTSGPVQYRKSAIRRLPLLCACSESSLTNLILLCLKSQSEPESHWTYPEVAILGDDDQKEHQHDNFTHNVSHHYRDHGQRWENLHCPKNQLDCRIC